MMTREHRVLRQCGLISTAAGVVMLIATIALVYRAMAASAETRMVQGQVIELIERSENGATAYAPRVEFETEEGETVRFVSVEAANPAAYRLYESVPVSYVQGRPQDARIGGSTGPWAAAGICGAIGLLLLAIGRACLRVVRDWGLNGSRGNTPAPRARRT